MLFDLRGRGRRRTVQGIYLMLALLMGVGLVGFGIGGGFGGGGIVDALKSGHGGSPTSFSDRVASDQKQTRLYPNNPAVWATLAHDAFQLAGQGDNYSQATGQFTDKGRAVLGQVKSAWDRYLALSPAHPDADLANEMVQALGPGGLDQASDAVQALQIVVAARPPSVALFLLLAQLQYQAGHSREGDLASAKAVSLAPASERAAVQAQVKQFKQAGTKGANGASAAGAGASGASGTTITVPARR